MNYQTLHLLLKCGREFGHKRLRTHGLSDTECLICSFVSFHPGCQQEDVAQALRFDKTTVAKALHTAEGKGLVQRERHPTDRRRNVLRITEYGTERISAVADLHDQWLSRILSVLSPEEQERFEGYCVRLLHAAEALSDGAEAPGTESEISE